MNRTGWITGNMLAVMLVLFSWGASGANPVNVDFKGELLDWPCRVAPESASQDVVFRDTSLRQFWFWPGRTGSQRFSVKLVNCHSTTLGKTVKLVFRGGTEASLPGYLAVTGNNAGRLGIGIVDTDGSTLLKVGEAHNRGAGEVVTGGDVTLNFMAYVQATFDAITQKSVVPGIFQSVATFELSYL
ncbi:fimbrial protein [Shigella sonnei]